ncbi:hypothetical protein K469DRAFT_750160 [Zopfia rhizophila CBS 207.26]|uniref:Uncharacterized protein n=1 Tax=Zopfia rhizophila CBS 207.26 TaxID=1314779 RepID=A0A6A6E1Q9_9PEZI|nr:hypothetical protein K469DRAFT_750160 [Zopfia rhizophila CBS 207.26]
MRDPHYILRRHSFSGAPLSPQPELSVLNFQTVEFELVDTSHPNTESPPRPSINLPPTAVISPLSICHSILSPPTNTTPPRLEVDKPDPVSTNEPFPRLPFQNLDEYGFLHRRYQPPVTTIPGLRDSALDNEKKDEKGRNWCTAIITGVSDPGDLGEYRAQSLVRLGERRVVPGQYAQWVIEVERGREEIVSEEQGRATLELYAPLAFEA